MFVLTLPVKTATEPQEQKEQGTSNTQRATPIPKKSKNCRHKCFIRQWRDMELRTLDEHPPSSRTALKTRIARLVKRLEWPGSSRRLPQTAIRGWQHLRNTCISGSGVGGSAPHDSKEIPTYQTNQLQYTTKEKPKFKAIQTKEHTALTSTIASTNQNLS